MEEDNDMRQYDRGSPTACWSTTVDQEKGTGAITSWPTTRCHSETRRELAPPKRRPTCGQRPIENQLTTNDDKLKKRAYEYSWRELSALVFLYAIVRVEIRFLRPVNSYSVDLGLSHSLLSPLSSLFGSLLKLLPQVLWNHAIIISFIHCNLVICCTSISCASVTCDVCHYFENLSDSLDRLAFQFVVFISSSTIVLLSLPEKNPIKRPDLHRATNCHNKESLMLGSQEKMTRSPIIRTESIHYSCEMSMRGKKE